MLIVIVLFAAAFIVTWLILRLFRPKEPNA